MYIHHPCDIHTRGGEHNPSHHPSTLWQVLKILLRMLGGERRRRDRSAEQHLDELYDAATRWFSQLEHQKRELHVLYTLHR